MEPMKPPAPTASTDKISFIFFETVTKPTDNLRDLQSILGRLGLGIRSGLSQFNKNLRSQKALLAGDIEMSDHPEGARTQGKNEHPTLPGPEDDLGRLRSIARQMEDEDIGLNGGKVEKDPRTFDKSSGDTPGMDVVLDEPFHMVIERVQTGGGKDPDLAHRPAEHAPVAHGPIHEGARPGEQGAPGGPQPLRERDCDDVERSGEFGAGSATGDRGVPETGPIEIGCDLIHAGRRTDLFGFLDGENHPARPVVRVLDFDECGGGAGELSVRNFSQKKLGCGKTTLRPDLSELDTRVCRRSAGLMPYGVALPADDHVVPGSGKDAERDLIGHRSRRQPKRGLFTQQSRYAFLEPVHRGIFSKLIIPYRGGGKNRAHLRRGPGDRIGAQIDWKNIHHRMASELLLAFRR